MKICIVSRNINNGNSSGNFELDQAVALREYGHDVYMISMDLRSVRRKRKFGIYETVCRGIPVMKCSIPIGAANGKIFQFVGSRAFARAYRELEKKVGRFDIINSHFLNISFVALRGLRELLKSEVPVAVTEHFSKMNVDKNEISPENLQKGEYVYSKADKVIAVSGALAEKLEKNFGVKSEVVFNVFESDIFKNAKSGRGNGERFSFVSAGNLRKIKRMDLLIRSFVKAFPRDKETCLYIFGDGPEMGSLERLIDELGVRERVFLMGRRPQEEIADFYGIADAFALVSERETFGVAFIEAMASGMPVLSSKCGGPEDFIIPETGILVDDDEQSIADGMKGIKSHRDDYEDSFISEYAQKICGRQVIAKQLTDIYEKMI